MPVSGRHAPALRRSIRRGSSLLLAAALLLPSLAWAATTARHELSAGWAGNPTTAPFGTAIVSEWRISTNDANNPAANDPVDNVRLTLTATNGAFPTMPAVCKTRGVTPVSAISANGSQLLCNLGTITEGTATVVQAPVMPNGAIGAVLSLSGSATSDAATAAPAPATTPGLPIVGSHGMDLALVAPNQNYQQTTVPSRSGGNRPSIAVDYGISMSAGSVPGPATYTFTLDIAVSVAGQLPGLQWEGCAPVDDSVQAPGIPHSASSYPNRTNFPTCSISGSGTHYTVTLSGLDYSLQHVPTVDSLYQPIPSTTNFIASGQLIFSYTTPITQSTGVTFGATPSQFTFIDGVTQSETNTGNNVSGTTLVLPGQFAISWLGGPAVGRMQWDANLFAAPGAAADKTLPWPAAGTSTNPGPYTAYDQPLVSQADSVTWSVYSGAGGADMAGACSMVQNPAAFVPRWADFVAADGAFYTNMKTAHLWYRTDALNTKTETCGQPVGVAGSPWIAAPLPAGCATQALPISPAYSDDQCIVSLPPGVTAVKMTWDPAVDKQFHHFLRVWGYVPTTAPVGGESWTVGAFNAPFNVTTAFPGYPNLNNYVNFSTSPAVYATIPGSVYGPNTNGQRDAMRIQGANGVITKAASSPTALPGVPVTFNLVAEADLAVANPPPQTFTVTDTLPVGMTYVTGTGTPTPALSTNGSGQQVLTYTFTNVAANTPQPITYQAQTAPNSSIAPGTVLTNTAQIDVPGDNRIAAVKQATASVTVPSNGATTLGKSAESGVLSFSGDSSAWNLTIRSSDSVANPFTDTIDILPNVADGRGTNIDGTYSITGVTAPAGSTVYYSTAPVASLSDDPRAPSNGAPGSIAGNTVGWSTTAVAHPTAIRVIGPALAPGAAQAIRIAFTTPAGTSCNSPLPTDNKPGQKLVNSASTIAGHTVLPMLSSTTAVIGACVPEPIDFGDAPDSYGTLLASNGARHGIPGYDAVAKTATLMIGSHISAETDGQPDATASLDSYDDGVLPSGVVLTTGATTASAVVTAVNAKATPATLAGWIDFNRNGTFDAGERAQVTVPANTTTATAFTLNWSGLAPIPAAFNSFARFRIASSAAEVASPVGAAADGEVEDYAIPIQIDPLACNLALNGSFEAPNIQDDPANPSTAFVNGWAVWRTSQSTLDGWQVTAGTIDILRYFNNASDGAQSIDLWGTAPATFEQTFTGLVPGQAYGFSVDYSGLSTADSRANVYLDLGSGAQLLRTLAPSVNAVSNGNGGLPGVPQYTVVWQTYSYSFIATGTQATIRFINQTAPATLNTGLFIDNFKFRSNSPCQDFGDAPDSYGTRLASNGARHGIPSYNAAAKTAPLMLGSRISAETDGQPDANAALDSFDDGLVPSSLVLTTGATTASATVTAVNAKATPATIAGWIDFNNNGTFDAGERAQVTVPANTNTAAPFTLNWSGLAAIPAGFSSLARLRIASAAAEVASPIGAAADGEVEDYVVPIKQPIGCATSPSVFNTAVNAAGTGSLPVGSRDRNWEVGLGTLAGGPASVPNWIQAYVTGNAAPGSWANSPFGNADWTSYFANANQGGANVEEYHRYRFTLDGAVDPSTFALGIDFYADNSVWEVYVNGQAQSGQVAGLPQSPTNPYFYAGFTNANRAQLVLNRNWRSGPNEIVVLVRSAPGAVGFLAQVTSTSLCPIQIGVAKSANPTGVLTPNGNVTYTVIATNTGNVAAPNTLVTDALPNGIVSGTWTCTGASGAVCPNANGAMPLNQTIATFPGGGVVTYTIAAVVGPTPPASIINTAIAAPPGGGTCYPGNGPGPCTASVSNPPVPVVEISKTSPATLATPGGSVDYEVIVRNVGSVDASGTTVSDPLPAGLSAASWTCAASGGAICPNASGSGAISETIATFPAGGQLTYTIAATVDANPPAAIANTATAIPPTGGLCGDGTTPPCDSTVILPGAPRIGLTKSANPSGAVAPGGTVVYTIVATNAGNVAAPNTVVADAFPAGIASASWTCAAAGGAICPNANSGGTITPPADLLDQTIATFPIGASVTYTITATLTANPPTRVTNTAVATVPGGVCSPGNTPLPCTSTVENTLAEAQITIVKVPTALDGTPFAFTTTAPAPDAAFTLSSGTTLTRTFSAAPGTVSISEGANAGWVLIDLVCHNATGTATFTYTGATTNPSNGFERGDDTANVTVSNGDQVTCTYTNAQAALPTLAKYFNTDPPSDPPPQRPVIPRGGAALLTFVLSNKSPSANAQSGLAFTDTLPSGLVLANGDAPPSALVGANSCGGTITAQAGANAIALAGGSVAAGADCTFTVRVAAAP